MKSIILCEGATDCILLQYFMRKAYSWEDEGRNRIGNTFKFSRTLKHGDHHLTIGAVGGCGELASMFEKQLEVNSISAKADEGYRNIIIMADQDDEETFSSLEDKIRVCSRKYGIMIENLENNVWFQCTMSNARKEEITLRILLMVIPFEENGAMETFLLNAIAKEDPYDKRIIDKGDRFVETIDCEKRYLKKRRDITKAKFDIYFSIRTSANQFSERQNILKGVPWEEYSEIHKCFAALKEL